MVEYFPKEGYVFLGIFQVDRDRTQKGHWEFKRVAAEADLCCYHQKHGFAMPDDVSLRINKQAAINVLAKARFLCEVDKDHSSFIRKNSDKPYTEPHHLIPLAFQNQFEVSLDVEENIVSLCSNCHNEIHYGADADKLIKKLFAERCSDLKRTGIDLLLQEVLAMYGYHH